jgi:hypothetical protein
MPSLRINSLRIGTLVAYCAGMQTETQSPLVGVLVILTVATYAMLALSIALFFSL